MCELAPAKIRERGLAPTKTALPQRQTLFVLWEAAPAAEWASAKAVIFEKV
jgi:hypothetical protein